MFNIDENDKLVIDRLITVIDSSGNEVTGRIELKIDIPVLLAWSSKINIDEILEKFNINPFWIKAIKAIIRSKKK